MVFQRALREKLPQNNAGHNGYPLIVVELTDNTLSEKTQELSVIDINDAGMGITCTFPLLVGQKIKFKKDQPEWNLPDEGIVVWTFQTYQGYQAGVKFVQKADVVSNPYFGEKS